MRFIFIFLIFSCLVINTAFADDISELKEQIRTLTQTVQDLKNTVQTQQEEINILKETQTVKSEAAVAPSSSQTAAQNVNQEKPSLRSALSKVVPAKLIPEIGVVADVVAELGSSKIDSDDINQLKVRELELVLGSNVDPYSRLDATIAFTEQENVELEEAYLTRFGLPFNTTARIGRFLPKIGKMLPVHRDSIDTVDEPLVIQRYFGEEGEFKTGVDLTSILDLPLVSVHQVTLGVLQGGNGEGGTAFGPSWKRPTLYGHLKNYFDITDVTNFELGLSDAIGANDDNASFKVNVLGLDGTLRHIINPNQEVKLQGETYYLHRIQTPNGEIDDTTGDFIITNRPGGNFFGGYALCDLRLAQRWGTGLRFDCVQPVDRPISDPNKAELGYSAYLTFYQSEFARFRAQYSHVIRTTDKSEDRVFLQGTFAIGEHKHKLQ